MIREVDDIVLLSKVRGIAKVGVWRKVLRESESVDIVVVKNMHGMSSTLTLYHDSLARSTVGWKGRA